MSLPPNPEPRGAWVWLPAALLVAASLLVYSNTGHQTLILDDLSAIQRNAGLRALWPLSAALNPPPGPLSFCTRPIVNLTMAWDYALSRGRLDGFRRTNRMLHALCALALFALLNRVLRQGAEPGGAWTDPERLPPWLRGAAGDGARLTAWLTALVWTTHPLNTAAVNYLSQRGEMLVALFLFVMLYSLLRAAERATPGRWHLAAAAACLLGMGSKETMLVAPALALLFDRILLAGSWRELLRRRGLLHLVFWLTALWPLRLHYAYSPHVQPELWPERVYWKYFLTQCWGLTRMIRLSFWPHPLVFFYGMTLVSDPAAVWMQGLFLLSLAGATLVALWRWPRAGLAGAVFFGLLAPSSTVVPVLGQPVAEHRMYGPLAALLALVIGGLYVRLPRRKAAGVLAGAGLVVSVLFGLAAHHRNSQYATPLSIWRDTAEKLPGSHEAHNNLANALMEANQLEPAMAHYREALRLKPDYVDALINLAVLFNRLKRHEEAAALLGEARRLRPRSLQVLHNLATTFEEMGRPGEAVPHIEAMLRLTPRDRALYARLSRALSLAGRDDEALARLTAAVGRHPDDPELNNALGVLLCQLKRPDEALARFQAALAAPGAGPRVRLNLARALFDAGRRGEARAEFERVLREDPSLTEARRYLQQLGPAPGNVE